MRVAHLARKPIAEGSVGKNVLVHGTGGINIEASRVGGGESRVINNYASVASQGCINRGSEGTSHSGEVYSSQATTSGRWPANLLLLHKLGCRLAGTRKAPGYVINQWTDGAKPFGGGAGHPYQSTAIPETTEEVWECEEGCAVKELDSQSGVTKSPASYKRSAPGFNASIYGSGMGESAGKESLNFGDSGGASRFFKQFQDFHIPMRASGDCLCPACGLEYRRHPDDFRYLDQENRPFLHVLCDGTRVKL